MQVTLACLNGPYTLESTVRRDVPLHKLERRGKFSFSAVWRLRQPVAAGAARDGDRGESLPGAVRGLRDLAAVASAAHRGAGEYVDVPRPRLRKRLYQIGAVAFRSDRAWLAGAAPLLGRCQSRVHTTNPPSSTTVSTPRTSSPSIAYEAAKRLRARSASSPRHCCIGTVGRMRAREEPGSAADHAAPPARGARRCSPGDCRRRAAARHLARRAVELEVADRVIVRRRTRRRAAGAHRARRVRAAVDGGRVILQRRARGHGHRPSGHPE